jgi:hypothetical protein
MGIVRPKKRHALLATIIACGFDSVSHFCRSEGFDDKLMSRIIRGWLIPGPALQKRLSDCLGITINELGGML